MPQSVTPSSTTSTRDPGLPNNATIPASMETAVPPESFTTLPSRFSGRGWTAEIHVGDCIGTLGELDPEKCDHGDQVVNSNFTSPGWHTAVDPDGELLLFLPDATLGPTESKTSIIGYNFGDQNGEGVLTVEGEDIDILDPEGDTNDTPPTIIYDPGEQEQTLTLAPITVRPHARPAHH